MDFAALDTAALHRYLNHFDLIPHIHPSPLSALDPPPPSSLVNPPRSTSRGVSPPVSITPANRPRRESREQSRRRSSRLVEEGPQRTPILADVGEVDVALAAIARRHFETHAAREFESVAEFVKVVRARRAQR